MTVHHEYDNVEERVVNYWNARAVDFSAVKHNELHNELSDRWAAEITAMLPEGEKGLKILDVGTGTGYFAILLSKLGHEVTGIDLTPGMLAEAKKTAEEEGVDPTFIEMNAEELDFPDASFDAVVSRNLTWTLPEPEEAYREWMRVLKPGGILINFDADYANSVREKETKNDNVAPDAAYGHIGVTEELAKECDELTLMMSIADEMRPMWDLRQLMMNGAAEFSADVNLGARVLREYDLDTAPMFMVWGRKIGFKKK